MIFSERLDWNTRPNPIAQLLERKRAAGEPVLDLTVSNPTQAGIEYPAEEIGAALGSAEALRYEPAPLGLPAARQAVSAYYAARGIHAPPDRILLTASTSEAYAYLFKLFANPGDEVLVPRPSYPLFEYLARLENVRVVQYPLFYDHGWHVDLGALHSLVSPRTRAIVTVNPNNPTGSYLKRAELAALPGGLPIISDEVFADYPFHPDPQRALNAGFTLSGLSKIAGLPQMKLGWVVVPDPESLERLELIADTYLSVGAPVQAALPRLLALAGGIQRQIQQRTSANLAWLRGAIPPQSPIRVLDVEGGWYATLQVPRVRSELEWTLALLDQHAVLVQPGFFYDFEDEAFLVLSLLTPPADLREGVERLLGRMLN